MKKSKKTGPVNSMMGDALVFEVAEKFRNNNNLNKDLKFSKKQLEIVTTNE